MTEREGMESAALSRSFSETEVKDKAGTLPVYTQILISLKEFPLQTSTLLKSAALVSLTHTRARIEPQRCVRAV